MEKFSGVFVKILTLRFSGVYEIIFLMENP
jgi:hypothetical protein